MASEIRVNKINSRTGVGTITLSPTGVDFTGIATVATLKATTGIVTTLTATTGIVTTLTVDTARTTTGIVTTLTADTSRITTGIVTTLTADTAKVGAAVTISESGMEVTGVTTVTSSINIGSATTISSSSLEVNGVQYPTAGALSNRYLIINGAMQVAQRGDDFQPPASGDYTIDRFQAYQSSADAYDVQRVTDTPSGQGFKNSLKVTSNAATSIASGGYYYLGQRIEGNNWVQMGYGASGAKTCTVSFWVKSSLTGTHSGIFKNSAQNRSLAFEYTISSANTWEYKQITIAGDTSGTWLTGNGTGVWVYFSMGVGTTFATGTADTWQATNLVGTTGSVDLVATSGATWFLTGLQVEHGDKATPFEFISRSEELARCHRYFRRFCEGANYGAAPGSGTGTSSTVAFHNVVLSTEMRTTPTLETFSNLRNDDVTTGTSVTALSLVTSMSTNEQVFLQATSASGLTAYRPYHLLANNTGSAKLDLSAEL